MLVINVYVNTRLIDQVGIINTGHRNKDTGQHLYRINHPEDYKKEFNQFEIWHNRKDPWSILVEKILNVINQKPDFISDTLKIREQRKLFEFLLNEDII